MKISIVIPVYNEEGNISELYRRLIPVIKNDFSKFDYEIIFVDDGSSDSSFNELEKLHNRNHKIKILQFSRNFGHHIAITAGLDQAHGDLVVMMDGDLQDQPEEIPKLYAKLEEGYDVVYGVRGVRQDGYLKKICSKIFNIFIKRLIDEKIVINSTIFRIMTKEVVENINKLREHNRYIVGVIGWVGFKHISQAVKHGKRTKGKSKYNLKKQFQLAFDAIFSFSNYPLKIIIKLGLCFVGISFILLLYIVINKIIYGTPVLGWSSLISAIFIVGGMQIIIMGIIGEYIGRIYMESKDRPLYIIQKNTI